MNDKRGETSISGVMTPTEDEIIAAIALHFDSPEAVALMWLATMVRHFDPKAAAERLAERAAR